MKDPWGWNFGADTCPRCGNEEPTSGVLYESDFGVEVNRRFRCPNCDLAWVARFIFHENDIKGGGRPLPA